MQPRLFKEWIKKGYPFLRLFVLTLFILKTPINVGLDPYRKGSIVNVTTYVATVNYQQTTPTHAHPFRRPFNSLGPVGANMYSYSFSITAPATIDIESPVCVKMMIIAFIQVTIKSGLVPLIAQ